MPSTVSPSRRRREAEMDDEERSSAESLASSQGHKRIRREKPGAAYPADTQLLLEGFQSQANPSSFTGKPRSSAAFQPGAIVRVTVKNFVTYDDCDIFPGPSLNVVMGPNGTGKSTLVCAICLGLGWDPKYLGRQKEFSEFVKKGKDECFIEIEICKKANQSRNPIFRCSFKSDGSKASYSINGKSYSKKQTQEFARKYSIQIDNLCQFLPQDKVVEFAAMSPIDLLRSTQEAVGSKEMLAWHDELKKLRSQQKMAQMNQASNLDTLENLKGRQRMQEADVARLQEREQVKQNIQYWKQARPLAEYRESRDRQLREKEFCQQARNDLKNLERELEPALRAVTAKARYCEKLRAVVSQRQDALDSTDKDVRASAKTVEQLKDKLKDIEREIESEKHGVNEKKADIKRIEGTIANLEVQMRQDAPEFDVTSHNEQMRGKERRRNDIQDEAARLQAERRNLKKSAEQDISEIRRKKEGIENLNSRAGQQTNKLSRHSQDTFKAWEYIQKNQGEFKKQVFGPPIVECSVNDTKYVDMIETLFSKSDFIALTVQTPEDFLKLGEIVHDRLHLAKVNIRTVLSGPKDFPPPVPREELSKYGLSGWALDYVDGPEPVLAMLCEAVRLHASGVSIGDTSSQQYELLERSPISQWVTSKSVYRIIRRIEYGPSATSTSVRDIRPATIWTDEPVNLDEKRRFEREIEEIMMKVEEAKEKLEEMNSSLQGLSEENSGLADDLERLQEEKEAKQKALSAFRALPTRLKASQEKKADLEESIAGVRDRVRELLKSQERATLDRCQAALDYAATVERLLLAHQELQESEVMLIEAVSDHEILLERNKEVKASLEQRQREVEKSEELLQELTRKAKSLLVEAKRISREADEDLKVFLSEHSTESAEQIDQEIESEEARLEMIHEGNGGIIQEFQLRAKKIEGLEENVRKVNETLAELDGVINSIRSKWEPKLDKLIRRISEAFAYNMQQIKCAGEVEVQKEDDFDQWAIKIMVKFRENESLSQLDSHRQSGGERAVSTIFYLMSLQTLTKSPFRVVDEINQGMDPRNERLVHGRMVAIATGNDDWRPSHEDAQVTGSDDDNNASNHDGAEEEGEGGVRGHSQYFLITPKLLHGLHYEYGMRTLCVAVGKHLEPQAVDFGAAVKTKLKMKAEAAAVAYA